MELPRVKRTGRQTWMITIVIGSVMRKYKL